VMTKTFDAVRLMRELRDRLSEDMQEMTPAERLTYIREKASTTALGRALVRDDRQAVPLADAGHLPAGGG